MRFNFRNALRHRNLEAVHPHHSALRRALPTLLRDWGQPKMGFDILLYLGVCSFPIPGMDTSLGLFSNQDVCCLALRNVLLENFWLRDILLLPCITFTLDPFRLVSLRLYGFSLFYLFFFFFLTSAQGIHWLNMGSGSAYKILLSVDKKGVTHRASALPAVVVAGEWPNSLPSHHGYINGFIRNNLVATDINFARTSLYHRMLLRLIRGLWNTCCSGWTSGTHHRSDSRKGCRHYCRNQSLC